jgi:hypothetical protein
MADRKKPTRSALGLLAAVFAVVLSLRLWSHFHSVLIPGINGGYYPLQVRYLLSEGTLAFSDMPLYFYFLGGLSALWQWLSGAGINTFALPLIKLVDSFFYLLILPVLTWGPPATKRSSAWQLLLILSFAGLHLGPITWLGDLQKNAAAMPLALAALFYLWRYLLQGTRSKLLLFIVFTSLTGLTHFGTGAVLLLIIAIFAAHRWRYRALLPLLAGLVCSGIIIAAIDPERAQRLLTLPLDIWRGPALFSPHFARLAIPWVLLSGLTMLLYRVFRNRRGQFDPAESQLFIAACLSSIVLLLPLSNSDYFKRFFLLSLLPQLLMLAMLLPTNGKSKAWRLPTVFMLLVIALGLLALPRKQATLTTVEISEIRAAITRLPKNERLILVAEHGREWWLAWFSGHPIANAKGYGPGLFATYSGAYLVQFKRPLPGPPTPQAQYDSPARLDRLPVATGEILYRGSEVQVQRLLPGDRN